MDPKKSPVLYRPSQFQFGDVPVPPGRSQVLEALIGEINGSCREFSLTQCGDERLFGNDRGGRG